MNQRYVRRCISASLMAVSAMYFGCSGNTDVPVPGKAKSERLVPGFTTFVNKSLEIDQLGSSPPHDANAFVGTDPADGSASAQKPTGGPASFIDWNDLGPNVANHRLMDVYSGKDATSFPRSNECVADSQVLSKMDLTYIAVANNNQFVYLAVQRSDNNGDAGYYWLFTQKEPHLVAGQSPCRPSEERLTYDITGPTSTSGGDVLVGGHFHPNGTPFLQVYRATSSVNGVDAVSAIDFTSALWSLDASGVAAVAVNTTVMAPGAFGSAGVGAMDGSNLEAEIFAEAAVPMSVFTNGSACGKTFYGSVITRSSGAGGTSPDLKDLAGPALFIFGGLTATATLTGSCTSSLGFAASATGPDGQPLGSPTCAWSFSDGGSSTVCSGSRTVLAGSHTGTVTVTDPNSGCSATASSAPATVYAPLAVNLALSGAAQTCPSMTSDAATWNAVASGGASPYSYSWTGATCSGASCTVDPSDSSFCATASIQVTLSDSSGVCPSVNSEIETYSKLTTVTASNN